jgi:hypothetical protein
VVPSRTIASQHFRGSCWSTTASWLFLRARSEAMMADTPAQEDARIKELVALIKSNHPDLTEEEILDMLEET